MRLSMPRSSARRMTPRSRRFSTARRSRAQAHRRVAGDAADRLLALLVVAAQQQVGDAFLGEDVRHVVAVDHHRRQRHVRAARRAAQASSVSTNAGCMCSRKVSTICTTSFRPRGIALPLPSPRASRPALQPRRARVAAAARVGAHVRRAAEAGDAAQRRGRAVAGEIDLQRRADEHVAGVVAGRLAEGAVGAHAMPSAPVKNTSGRARDVVLHAELGAEGVDRSRRSPPRSRGSAPGADSAPSGVQILPLSPSAAA